MGPFAEAKKFCADKEAYLKQVRQRIYLTVDSLRVLAVCFSSAGCTATSCSRENSRVVPIVKSRFNVAPRGYGWAAAPPPPSAAGAAAGANHHTRTSSQPITPLHGLVARLSGVGGRCVLAVATYIRTT